MKSSHLFLFSLFALSSLVAQDIYLPSLSPENFLEDLENFQEDLAYELEEKTLAVDEHTVDIPSPKKESVSPPENSEMPPQVLMFNTAARPLAPNSCGLSVMGELLIWQATEDNLAYAYAGQLVDINHVRNALTPHFNWDCGCRISLGYDTPRDGWDTVLTWTHIQNTARGSTNFDTSSGYQVWATSETAITGTATYANAHLHIDLDQVNWLLGREFYVGRDITLRPSAGVCSAWIFQRFNVDFATTTAYQEARMTERFWGFGFVGGMNTDWKLCHGLSISGNMGLSLLMGFFSVQERGQTTTTTLWDQHRSFRSVKPIFDLGLGLQWEKTFCDEQFGIVLKGGYEYHLYLEQNQFFLSQGSGTLENQAPMTGDLGYQGATVSAQFNF